MGYVVTYVFTCVIYVNMSHIPEEGAHSPSWHNGLIIVIIIKHAQNNMGNVISAKHSVRNQCGVCDVCDTHWGRVKRLGMCVKWGAGMSIGDLVGDHIVTTCLEDWANAQ
jgi:hypothetical protein